MPSGEISCKSKTRTFSGTGIVQEHSQQILMTNFLKICEKSYLDQFWTIFSHFFPKEEIPMQRPTRSP